MVDIDSRNGLIDLTIPRTDDCNTAFEALTFQEWFIFVLRVHAAVLLALPAYYGGWLGIFRRRRKC
jgi:hypothetical protein